MRSALAILLGASLWLAPRTASGQIALATNQGLSFGRLIPGATRPVPVTDVVNRGEVVLSGAGRYTVSFSLPTSLMHQTSAVGMPISFGAADGQVWQRKGSYGFDPRLGTDVKLQGANNTATLYLGGTIQAAAAQPAGTYSGTITVTVVP